MFLVESLFFTFVVVLGNVHFFKIKFHVGLTGLPARLMFIKLWCFSFRWFWNNVIPLWQCFPMSTMFKKSAFYHLRTISRTRKYLSTQTTEILIHAFVTSKLNHCNSLLYNVPKNVIKKLQSLQNAAARLITRSRKCDHITPILFDPHWLPVSERIKFKIPLLTFKALHQQSPTYIQDLIPATCRLDRFGHLLRSIWILLALTF